MRPADHSRMVFFRLNSSRLMWIYPLLLSLLPVFFLVACSRESPPHDESASSQKVAASSPVEQGRQPRYGGIYRRPLRNEPPTLDPAFVTDIFAITVTNEIFDGLVQFDGDLNVLPALARSWEGSRDGLTWTFHLREKAQFHNGRVVTAHDVVYSFTRMLNPAMKSPNAWLFEKVKGAEAFRRGEASTVSGFEVKDEHTLTITLAEPFAPFITLLGMAQARVVPREEVERAGNEFGRHPVGTGPFRFVRWEKGKAITLEANPVYFEGRPYLDGIRFVLFSGSDTTHIFQEFAANRLEDAYIPLPQRSQLIQDSRFTLVRKPTLSLLHIGMNNTIPPLNDPKVRQALNYAINRERINREIRQNRFEIATGILPPGMPGYNPKLAGYRYNPEKARQLLAEAGYPEGRGFPVLELWTSAKSAVVRQEHEAIQRDLAAIGVQVELKFAPNWATFLEMLKQGKAPLYRRAWYADFPDPDNFLYVLLYSESANNYSRYHNPQVDTLLRQARAETDYLKRIEIYREAERIIMQDAPWINLVYYTYEHLFQPYVRGIEINALGEMSIPMKKIWLDKASAEMQSALRKE
ncbi:MAG: ABC transporter substrate-binding protein [Nitrospinota bacterium]|nr:MAG: ABC transporter substrate-binding protein [Nitrospinota bacterium]